MTRRLVDPRYAANIGSVIAKELIEQPYSDYIELRIEQKFLPSKRRRIIEVSIYEDDGLSLWDRIKEWWKWRQLRKTFGYQKN
jgi:hypothetical protein